MLLKIQFLKSQIVIGLKVANSYSSIENNINAIQSYQNFM